MKNFVEKYLKYIVLGCAVAALVFGISRGEVNTVFMKAVAICMECIGIG